MSRSARSNDETESLIKELQTKAETAVENLIKSSDWSAWLKWSSHFWRYSFANQVLIFCQNHEATMVNSYKRWSELGRMVRKGEKSIRIWAPMSVKTNMIEVSTGVDGEETETPIKRTAFRLVPVFDIAQTDGDAMPPEHPGKGELALDNPAVFDDYVILWEALESRGVDVDFEEIKSDAEGYYMAPSTIRLNSANPNLANRFAALLHEAAHYLGDHKPEFDRQDKEVQAELAAYIAASAIGYDLAPTSIHYLASWADDEKTLKKNANAVQSIAKALIELFPLPKAETIEQQADSPPVDTPKGGHIMTHLSHSDLAALLDETTCTRCRQQNTDARNVYYPGSDEYIQLCTGCEPRDVADSSFCHTFARVEHLRKWQEQQHDFAYVRRDRRTEMTTQEIQKLFTDADLGFAIGDARNWEHTPDREYAANLFGALDKQLAPGSESSIWGYVLEAMNDQAQELTESIPWWINIYDALYEARACDDQEAEDQIYLAVYEGRGDHVRRQDKAS